MTTITIQTGTPLSANHLPRGSRIAADLFGRFLALFSAATPVESQSRADEAEHVRSLARRVQASDPGFAADLYAAADRHEGIEA